MIVVGLGGAGSAAAYHLARSGLDVLGLEQFGPNHARGSSHGRSRIYRTAYYEGAAYVPFVRRAQRLWRELQGESGLPILQETGALTLGAPESRPVAGALRSARQYRLVHELLDPPEVRARFPQFRIAPGEVALWERQAGVLFPETCNAAHALGAVEAGAELHYREPVRAWSTPNGGVEVRTSSTTYRADRLVLTAGPWTTGLAPDLHLPLRLERHVVFWFRPRIAPERYRPERMPVFLWASPTEQFAYGIPDLGDGVKVASGSGRPIRRPEGSGPKLRPGEAAGVQRFVRSHLPGLVDRPQAHTACIYTNAPDHDFVLGYHPQREKVIVVSACSGHGFKFASVVGETVARLALGRPLDPSLRRFDPARFSVVAGQ